MDHRFIPTSRVKTVNPPQTQPLPCKPEALVPHLPSPQAGRHTPFLVDTVPHAKGSGCRARPFAQRVTVAPLDCPSPPSPSVTLPALFGSFWLFLALFGSFWFILVLFGSFWLFLALFGSFWLPLFGSFWLFLVLFGSFWLFLAPTPTAKLDTRRLRHPPSPFAKLRLFVTDCIPKPGQWTRRPFSATRNALFSSESHHPPSRRNLSKPLLSQKSGPCQKGFFQRGNFKNLMAIP